MKLAEAIFPEVPYTSRTRGVVYFERGAVMRLDHHKGVVDAMVRGTEVYRVRLEGSPNIVRGSCSCAYFKDHLHPCKHVWAVALACDARNVALLDPGMKGRRVRFLPIDPDEEEVDDADDVAAYDSRFGAPAGAVLGRAPRRSAAPPWKQALTAIGAARTPEIYTPPVPGRLLYIVDLAASQQNRTLVIHLMSQEPKRNGDWGVPKAARVSMSALGDLGPEDRDILERLTGARPAYTWAWGAQTYEFPSPFLLRGALAAEVFPVMCRTGRCRLAATQAPAMRPQDSPITPLPWDAGAPWVSSVDVQRDDVQHAYVVTGELRRESEVLTLTQAVLLLPEGLVLTWNGAARLEHRNALAWMDQLRLRERVVVPIEERDLLRRTIVASQPPTGDLPEELRVEILDGVPRPRLSLRPLRFDPRSLAADVSFDYGGAVVPIDAPSALAETGTPQIVVRRDRAAERAAIDRLHALGIKPTWVPDGPQVLQIPTVQLPRLVRVLVTEGWQVEAEGRRYRLAAEAVAIDVRSGIDWFELHGHASFDDQRVGLPALLAAMERGDGSIALGDGTIGILPEDWLRTYGALGIGVRDGEGLRFRTSQVALLDALLAARPAVSWDDTFAKARRQLHELSAISALDPPPTFVGVLREYQREGLGWMTALRAFDFGGCLADDMGLGKTVMVLALLEARRQERAAKGEARRPSLVVAPRSVVFNWQQEAARFTPELKVLDHSHATRAEQHDRILDSDLVLTTYGALRRDAPRLAEQQFDYIVLDEAQTIKNAGTVTAKAARLLNADHRLALSGTPVENRLADLWSLFEFLNPGLLSNAGRFSRVFSGKDADEEQLKLLAQGLRPFILRRTKEQVASELPPKTEQTIYCELERNQRKLYDELRDHYRRRLLHGTASWQRSKFQVLEALLRLRQAACHPGLVDAARTRDGSAKLDLLVPRLVEAIEEGHKTLVFSQFTSFLALLRAQLDDKGIEYEYLDGKTRDRATRVERFQNDPGCRLFLISLKAGGLGLNLTAADYVFLLDPWWNPAAEAQAIDRTHRIGQLRRVFAYRLIAKDTVEERVVELQQRKRSLVEAIMTADNSVLRGLQREDLELLLS